MDMIPSKTVLLYASGNDEISVQAARDYISQYNLTMPDVSLQADKEGVFITSKKPLKLEEQNAQRT